MGRVRKFIREHFLPSKIKYPNEIDHFELYQIKPTPTSRKCMYMSLDMIKRMGYSLSKDTYTLVYTDKIKTIPESIEVLLDNIFTRFNVDIPRNFGGRTMSVSDIIVIYANAQKTTYYTDGCGFTRLPDDFWET